MRDTYRPNPAASFMKMVITIVVLGAVSFGAATVWENAEESFVASAAEASSTKNKSSSSAAASSKIESGSTEDEYTDIDMGEDALPKVASSSPSDVGKIKTASEAAAAKGTSSSSSAAVPAKTFSRAALEGSVPESKVVNYNYFDDAIFFGDSISTGIPLYMQTLVPNAAVIAAQGVSPGGANTAECITVGGKRVTMLQAAKSKGDRKKVYIMLGANALDSDKENFMSGYKTFVEAVKQMYPEADIYIQSMLPVTSGVNRVYTSKNINNKRISEYNAEILKLAQAQGVNYVDVAQGIVDSEGMLPKEASPLDGMHLTPEYYIKWFDYLRTHTVLPKTKKG